MKTIRSINLYGVAQDRTPVITEIKRSQPTPFAVFQLKVYVLRPSAPAHGACEGLQDTVRINHIIHDKNTAHQERAWVAGIRL